jgi:hypothetical protein
MTDLRDKTTDELRQMAAKLRHPDHKEQRLLVLAELQRREEEEERKVIPLEPEEQRTEEQRTEEEILHGRPGAPEPQGILDARHTIECDETHST